MLRLVTIFVAVSWVYATYNPEENAGLFEGDLKLLPGQKFAIEHGLDVEPVSTFGASKTRRWTNGIVRYTLASSLASSSSATRVIQSAMKEWSERTCIKFEKRSSQSQYIEFFKGSGCWSYVGMTGRKQQISLAGGCWRHGIVVHEIGHALGFWHEQSRPDRDDHVTIVWDNIRPQNRHNFNKYSKTSIDSLNVPYDYGSIMHYGKRAFSINGRDTIIPKKSGVTLGQRGGLSPSDVKQMNLMYNCPGTTSKPPGPTPTRPTTQRPSPPRPTTQRPSPPRPTTQRPSPPRPTTQRPSPPRPTTQRPSPPRPTTQRPSPPRPTTQRPSPPRPTTQRPSPPSGSIRVFIRSEGCDDDHMENVRCGRAYIKVNGRDYARKGRGHNIVVVDHRTGRVESFRSYDTHGSTEQSSAMGRFLNGLPNNKIVLVAIQDEGASRLTRYAKGALARIGASRSYYAYRGSQALIGYTAATSGERPSFVKEVKRGRRQGPSVIAEVTLPAYVPGTVRPPTRPSTRPTRPTPRPTRPSTGPTRPTPRPTRPTVTIKPPVGSCGKSQVLQRVIGGVNAAPGAWPWQIALLNPQGRFFCGGTLIDSQWVVTAAHCISTRQASYYTVLLGAHNRNSPQPHEQKIKAVKVVVHSMYNTPRLSSDIALIKLSRPATLNSRVGIACLPSHNYQLPLSSTCFITGWGKIRHPGSSHHTLQQAQLPPVEQNECKRKLAASPSGSSLKITEQMLCAGKKDTVLSGCHGDSGGPYVCRDSSNRFVLHGVVSWGSPRCAARERYTVFARVAKFRSWIDEQISGGRVKWG